MEGSDLTLEKTLTIADTLESAEREARAMEEQPAPVPVQAVQQRARRSNRGSRGGRPSGPPPPHQPQQPLPRQQQQQQQQQSGSAGVCWGCGLSGHRRLAHDVAGVQGSSGDARFRRSEGLHLGRKRVFFRL